MRGVRGEAGLALIIAWKAVKCVVLLAAGAGLLASLHGGFEPLIERIASAIHVAPEMLEGRLTRRNLTLAGFGLIGVAAVNAVEAGGLYLGKSWAAWLVVIATASLVPIEMYRIVLQPDLFRILTLCANGAVVWYLANRIRARARARARIRP